MPVYVLTDSLVFPPAEFANESGLLAIGGDLAPQRLISAYRAGIFPWYNEGDPILWWSPDPRMVLYPSRLHVSRSMRKVLNRANFNVTMDKAFGEIINGCAAVRIAKGQGTWLTPEMIDAYIELYQMGIAHSVETWSDGEIVGGLYGVSLGLCFFGESMFSLRPNASKVALYYLVKYMEKYGLMFIDCQVYSEHMERLGACRVPRRQFLNELRFALAGQTLRGRWDGIYCNKAASW